MSQKKTSSNEIRVKNRQMIYRFIRNHDSVSKQDIVVGLQLSLPTVTQNLQHLEQQGLIDTSGKIRNTGGRDATAFTYIKDARMAIGVYTTANHINVVAVDLSGNVIQVTRERIRFNLDDDNYLRKMGELVEQVKNEVGISDDKLLGVGISVPGLVSDDGERVIYGLTLNFTGKTRAEIARYIPYQNRLFHDSYAAGYAEVWIDKRVRNAFYISLSNSVGGSVIINNEVYEGESNRGGEVGHMIVVPEGGKQCYCGQYGCLETICSAGNLDHYTGGNLEEFFQLLDAGDETAGKLWNSYLDNVALGIHNVRMLFNNVVILGGYVGAVIEDYLEELYRRVDKLDPFGEKACDYLIPCKYKIEATAAGAAILYINDFINRI